jgi:hypothetical protein
VPLRAFDPKRFPEIEALIIIVRINSHLRGHHDSGGEVRRESNEDRFNSLPPTRQAG